MATQAQIHANRQNARKSTGPRTAEGKATASQNSLKHGLLAQQAVIKGEDPGQFEFYRDQMLAELAPAGAMESMLAERAVGLAWRLKRAERVQAEVFDALLAQDDSPLARLTRSAQARAFGRSNSSNADTETALGRAMVKDFASTRVLDRLTMYERRLEHSLFKTMAELQRLRLLREIEPPLHEQEAILTDTPPRQTNPIAAGVLSAAERIGPVSSTENAPNRLSEPQKAPSSLTSPTPSAIISPSANAETRHRQFPARSPVGRRAARTGEDRKQPVASPTRGRGRQLEGLTRP